MATHSCVIAPHLKSSLLDGEYLGEVGGRIVAEVLLGLIAGDPASYLNAAQVWQPELPAATPGQFTMADFLKFAGAA